MKIFTKEEICERCRGRFTTESSVEIIIFRKTRWPFDFLCLYFITAGVAAVPGTIHFCLLKRRGYLLRQNIPQAAGCELDQLRRRQNKSIPSQGLLNSFVDQFQVER